MSEAGVDGRPSEAGADGRPSEAGAGGGIGRARRMILIVAHVAVIRTLYRSLRCRGWCIVARGTKLKISRRARIELTPGSRLYLGFGLTSFTGRRGFLPRGPGGPPAR